MNLICKNKLTINGAADPYVQPSPHITYYPNVLAPTELGQLETITSFSYAEVIDLISDGPIEGLVNLNSTVVNDDNIFEGMYFNEKPIKETSTKRVFSSDELSNGIAYYLSDFWSLNQLNFSKTYSVYNNNFSSITITSYAAGATSVNRFIYENKINSSIGNIIYKKFTSLPTTNDDVFLTIIDIPRIELFYKFGGFDFSEGGDGSNPIKLGVSNISEHIYPYLNLSIINNYNYFEMPKSFVQNKIINASNKKTFEKDTLGISNFRLYIWSIYDKSTNSIRNIDYILNNHFKIFAYQDSFSLYNYNLVQAEIKNGSAIQTPLLSFSNSEIGIDITQELQGPYRTSTDTNSNVQRLCSFDGSNTLNVSLSNESSNDYRAIKSWPVEYDCNGNPYLICNFCPSYSSYDSTSANKTQQDAVSITHYIVNENVNYLYLTIGIDMLYDTAHTDLVNDNDPGKITKIDQGYSAPAGIKTFSQICQAGTPSYLFKNVNPGTLGILECVGCIGDIIPAISKPEIANMKQNITVATKLPTVVSFKVETGYENCSTIYWSYRYDIFGLAQQAAFLDIGRNQYNYVCQNYIANSLGNSPGIPLPPILLDNNNYQFKRFVKVTRLSHETTSTLIGKRISLQKVTEVIPQLFSYPYSAIIGTKIDARAIGEMPTRTFDVKLKKVLVPSNYYFLDEFNNDLRYSKSSIGKSLYNGIWDGSFKLQWTNNPAWILMDLLLSKRYGLGNFIEPEQIDIWELYSISKWCDATDDNGVFVGVDDTYNSVEPRFTFNAIFSEKQNIFDILTQVAGIFGGSIYYMNSLITFDDDRVKDIAGIFTESDVKDGNFNYANQRKDNEYSAVEVSYMDFRDSFKPKIEYIEDSNAIRKYGILKKTINSIGTTSRGQARRLGNNFLYKTSKENSNVVFITDSKALLYKPGDLIKVSDTSVFGYGSKNFGKVIKAN